jgi:hypothetical protein
LLTDNAMKDNFTGTLFPNNRWGYGKLDILKTLTALVQPDNIDNFHSILGYDDWSRSSSDALNFSNNVQVSGSASEKYSIRFTPTYESRLTGLLFHTYTTVTLNNNVTAEIWTNNPLTNLPDSRLYGPFTISPAEIAAAGWNYIDAPKDSVMTLSANSDYHLVLYPASGTTDVLSLTRDNIAVSGRSSHFASGAWSQYTSGDIRLRAAIAGTSVMLPVELKSIAAAITNRTVRLTWTTATETNNYGFNIERKKIGTGENWKSVGFCSGHGTSATAHSYAFTDPDASLNGAYLYRLGQIDQDGSVHYSSEIAATVLSPVQFTVHQNYPNPFNPSTTISYDLPETRHTKVVIFDCLGKIVATLVDKQQDAGSYKITFDASKFASGMYFYKISSGTMTAIRKMVLLK